MSNDSDIYRLIFSREDFTFEEKLELCVIYAQWEIYFAIENAEAKYCIKKEHKMRIQHLNMAMQKQIRELFLSAKSFLLADALMYRSSDPIFVNPEHPYIIP